jgi:hypothetical protein
MSIRSVLFFEPPPAAARPARGPNITVAPTVVFSHLEETAGGQAVARLSLFESSNRISEGRASLLRAGDGEIIRTRPFAVRGFSMSVESWLDPDKDLLVKFYESYMDALAKRILSAMVFQTDLAPVAGSGYCWMAPIEPVSSYFRVRGVDSLTPLLRWTPFTGNTDNDQLADRSPGRITDIVYDLKIWNGLGDLSYERTGVTDSTHIVSEPLTIVPGHYGWGKHFYWSVRARFREDGIEKWTGWASHFPRGDLPPGWTVVPQDDKEMMWNQEWCLTEDVKKDLSSETIARAKCTGGARGGSFRFKYRAPPKAGK